MLMRPLPGVVAVLSSSRVMGGPHPCKHQCRRQNTCTSLIAVLPRAGISKSFKGRVPQLLRHPNGAAVIDDAYNAAYPAQRNAMAAEFYGKEFSLFEVSVNESLP
jgi:hypothetical protein